jgi:hypothetical protein
MKSQTINNIPSRTITDYLDTEYAAYGMYTIENRAIPSVIDGFKPTQRKIIFVANRMWKGGSDKPAKVFQFGGRIAAEAQYHHGDTSLNAMKVRTEQSRILLSTIYGVDVANKILEDRDYGVDVANKILEDRELLMLTLAVLDSNGTDVKAINDLRNALELKTK